MAEALKPGDARKILLMVLDGMGDRPVKELGSKTPLQYAAKRAMDKFASEGTCGIMDTIGRGIRPGSDTAHLALLGYNPYEVYTGRGPFEALGIGMDVRAGDVAFRCNFATVDTRMVVTDRRAGRIREGTDELGRSLDGMEIDGVKILFKPAVEHRAVLILRGKGLCAKVTDADPHSEGQKVHESNPSVNNNATDFKDAEFTAKVLNKFVLESYKALNAHLVNKERTKNGELPANIILPRGAGMAPHIPKISDRYGMKSSCVAGISLVKGICRYVGMEIPDVKGATGGTDTDLGAKMKAVLRELDKNDFVLLNIKALDIFGHDGDAKGKAAYIGKIDRQLKFLFSNIGENVVVALTADHSTPVSVRDHSGDPVPLAICGPHVRKDVIIKYDEVSCASGALGRIRGMDLLPVMLDLANRSEKYGA